MNRSTTTELVRAELGRPPLLAYAMIRNIRYINYVSYKDDTILVKQAYNYDISSTSNRSTIMNLYTCHEDQLDQFRLGNILDLPKHKAREIIFKLFEAIWKIEVVKFIKAEQYLAFKNNNKPANYLSLIKNRKHRVAITKLRLSDHDLEIEMGRRKVPKVERQLRICKLCHKEVENEIHFLTNCEVYQDRPFIFNQVSQLVPNFELRYNYNNKDKFIFLMSQENELIWLLLAKQIFNWLKKRKYLISNP